jgi:hypothetical protein
MFNKTAPVTEPPHDRMVPADLIPSAMSHWICRSRQMGGPLTSMPKVCGTSDLEIGRGYVKQVEIVSDDRSSPRNGLGLRERPVSIKDRCR